MQEVKIYPEKNFSFELCKRNTFFEEKGLKSPRFISTGTTIVGIIVNDGVILASDTRATSGSIVGDKNVKKIHYIAPNIYCCGAGTAADTEKTTALISQKLALIRLNTNRESKVINGATMIRQYLYRYQGYISAALVLGGVDSTGPHIYSIHPHGSSERLPYTTLGSGSLAALSVLESGYIPNMSQEAGIDLATEAIKAGILNDLFSGSNVDITTITSKGVVTKRSHLVLGIQPKKELTYVFPRGSTVILDEKTRIFKKSTYQPDPIDEGDDLYDV